MNQVPTCYLPPADPRMDAAAAYLVQQGYGVVRSKAAPHDHSVASPGAPGTGDIVPQNDEIFLSENGDITAEAAIFLAMGRLSRTIAGAHCLILGFGHIGKPLAKKLLSLGAQVTVQARSPKARQEAAQLGCLPQEIGIPGTFDVIFNTVPAPVYAPKGDPLCLDLASTPGFLPPSAGIAARGLPGTYAPESAGQSLGRSVARCLQEERL